MPAAAWIIVLSAAASVSLSLGARQTFGLFLLPLGVEHGISATVLGASVAIHNLVWGISQPFAGAIADRLGTGRVALGGAAIYAAGLLLPAIAPNAATLLIGIGILTGIGTAAAGAGTVLGAVARAVPENRRGDALGLASAGGSIGQAAMVPFAQWAIESGGTSFAFAMLASTMLLALVICPRLEWHAPIRVAGAAPAGIAGLPALARQALGDRDFALLTVGFFACGFQLAFLTMHLPSHLALCGLPTGLGVTALMLIGLFNIPGSWLCGRLGNVIRPEIALGGIYLLRTIAVAIFAATVPTAWGTMIFAAVMGFIWLGTIPLTSAAIARRFGVANLGALYGVCFLSHQVGGFIGAGAGAIVLDTTGSYDAFWPVMIGVGLVAILTNWATRAPRLAPA
ncbi:MFS transporter [Neoroseomonas terrae]|uniref:MFS transporter n=1 Tax=Neoroseomonas terrae TaxID=424799 RepID=UPI001BA78B12|nr:MFS transporter [Neoroseomonas terrae]